MCVPCPFVVAQNMLGDIARVNFGQEPFKFPPVDHLPLMNPLNHSSSWMTRFEHGVAVVERVHAREVPLPEPVVDMAFASETAESESKPLSVTFFSKSAGVQMVSSPFVDNSNGGAGAETSAVSSFEIVQTKQSGDSQQITAQVSGVGDCITAQVVGGDSGEPVYLHSVYVEAARCASQACPLSQGPTLFPRPRIVHPRIRTRTLALFRLVLLRGIGWAPA
jgi:hypothetical protein